MLYQGLTIYNMKLFVIPQSKHNWNDDERFRLTMKLFIVPWSEHNWNGDEVFRLGIQDMKSDVRWMNASACSFGPLASTPWAACLFWTWRRLDLQPLITDEVPQVFHMVAMQVAKHNSTWTALEKKCSVNFCYRLRQESRVLVTNAIWEWNDYYHSPIEESWPAAGGWIFMSRLLGGLYRRAARRITGLTWHMAITDTEPYFHLTAFLKQEITALAFQTVVLGPELAMDAHFTRIWNNPKVKKHINWVIIDEAHCVSQLGQDFPSSYLSLGWLYILLGNPSPIHSQWCPADHQAPKGYNSQSPFKWQTKYPPECPCYVVHNHIMSWLSLPGPSRSKDQERRMDLSENSTVPSILQLMLGHWEDC